MKNILSLLLISVFVSCNSNETINSDNKSIEQTEITNTKLKNYNFLECMYQDPYFPKFLVDKCKNILVELCLEIEAKKPSNLDELYLLTHSATEKLNDLQNEFFENESEIETVARECLAMDFDYIAKSYDFKADIEELIATREW